jgi:Protein of unknown function (DUF1592)/Protein of unknown function (DUF1588)/Protein of unknown function (DUF1595)/Protein of unknown function (DUF1585)/Protein of unknown function (DUF1587)
MILALAVAASDLACHSSTGLGPGNDAGLDAQGGNATAGNTMGGDAAGGAAGASPDGSAREASVDPGEGGPPVGFDPGSVGMRLLSDTEYARTVQDLLGLPGLDQKIMASFSSGKTGGDVRDFDNGPGAPVPSTRYAEYFSNAVTLAQQAFASDITRARIVTCAPASPTDDACTRAILRAFGLRAWRRPLSESELDALVAVVRADQTAGETSFPSAVEEGVIAMLASESFLYRVELDPPAPDTRAHLVTSYELASRLSYLLWGSMPDDALFAVAATDELQKPAVLAAQAARLLVDARADGFVQDFFGHWLGFSGFSASTPPPALGSSSPMLSTSMGEEARLFVTTVVQSDQDLGGLFTSDKNFVDAYLANLYDFRFNTPAFTFVEVDNTNDARAGYLGLAAFLALTSHADVTSPTERGRWILQHLLCAQVPEPPGAVPPLPATGTPREQASDRLARPECAGCHTTMDELGLGLEAFDQLGRFRTTYPLGEPIDNHGLLPDGTTYAGEIELGTRLATNPQFPACARRELIAYALGRDVAATDAARVAAIDAAWSAAGHSVRGLVAALVVDELFRYRRGEGQP